MWGEAVVTDQTAAWKFQYSGMEVAGILEGTLFRLPTPVSNGLVNMQGGARVSRGMLPVLEQEGRKEEQRHHPNQQSSSRGCGRCTCRAS